MKFGEQEIQLLNALRSISRVEAKDCLVLDKTISFVVEEGKIGQAIGKGGQNIKKLEETFKKRIEIVEFREKPENFLAGAFSNIKFNGFEFSQNGEQKKVLVAKTDQENKRKLLNSTGKLKRMKELLERNFDIADVKI
ncbi:MAG: NusA-like transcription termination signal-binding factor [Candidatus Diapherotrites archaeon]|uniref:NusA-like transcription termination signal-binding factor n=1 Tax=Candidatus Iainarchaeum sp. TaxID=3101447 RepID=A0A8T4LBG7_9ARCH|nr:NusA-like transcription termination signal-binding factor [Candidatus Diapherotrites archaeon]